MKETAKTLTVQDIRNAVKMLKKNNELPFQNPFWVDTKDWYKGCLAKDMGFDCTDKELDAVNAKGFIKQARGIDLYLSKRIDF